MSNRRGPEAPRLAKVQSDKLGGGGGVVGGSGSGCGGVGRESQGTSLFFEIPEANTIAVGEVGEEDGGPRLAV